MFAGWPTLSWNVVMMADRVGSRVAMALMGIKGARMDISEIVKVVNSLAQYRKDTRTI